MRPKHLSAVERTGTQARLSFRQVGVTQASLVPLLASAFSSVKRGRCSRGPVVLLSAMKFCDSTRIIFPVSVKQ